MRHYTLQIHNTNGKELDEIYSFRSPENLFREFENKFNYLKNLAEETISEDYPKFTEDGELVGGFKFGNADGTMTIGKVYDYDILDED